MKGRVVHEGASREDMDDYAKTIEASRKGEGGEPGDGSLDASRGDPRCESDWIVVDCFWCAAANCVNPRWHTANCRKCHGQFIY
jgi:hypothetical protein